MSAELDVYIICPVRRLKQEVREFLGQYVSGLEFEGRRVYWPPRNTDQTPQETCPVLFQSRDAIRGAREVHIYYDQSSIGSLLDIGMALMTDKPLMIINPEAVHKTPNRSIENLILELAEISKPHFIWQEYHEH